MSIYGLKYKDIDMGGKSSKPQNSATVSDNHNAFWANTAIPSHNKEKNKIDKKVDYCVLKTEYKVDKYAEKFEHKAHRCDERLENKGEKLEEKMDNCENRLRR